MRIGSALREQRLRLGLSVTEAASIGDVPRSYLSMVETGRRAPNPDVLVRFTRNVNIPKDVWMPVFLEDERRCSRLLALGRALFEEGDFQAARKALGCALFASRRVRDGRYDSDIHMLLGKAHYALGHYRTALRWFMLQEHAMSRCDDAWLRAVTTCNVAKCMSKIGREFEALPRFDDAIQTFSRLRLWPELGRAWLAKANTYFARRAYREAYVAYRRAVHFLRGRPFHGDALLGVAITTWLTKGVDTALPLFSAIIASERSDIVLRTKARGNLAAALRQAGRQQQALQHLSPVLLDRAELSSRLLTSILAETTLCQVACDDEAGARLTLDEYKKLAGERDGQDIATMRILARILEVPAPSEVMRDAPRDEYEHRLQAAVTLLRNRLASRSVLHF